MRVHVHMHVHVHVRASKCVGAWHESVCTCVHVCTHMHLHPSSYHPLSPSPIPPGPSPLLSPYPSLLFPPPSGPLFPIPPLPDSPPPLLPSPLRIPSISLPGMASCRQTPRRCRLACEEVPVINTGVADADGCLAEWARRQSVSQRTRTMQGSQRLS